MTGFSSLAVLPKRITAAALGLLLSLSAAQAMEFGVRSVHETDGGLETVLSATGPIEAGDDAKLHRVVAGLPARTVLRGIVLNSPGGLVDEGLALAATIYASHLDVGVEHACASACFFMFAAGHDRFVYATSGVGVHSASSGGHDTDGAKLTTLKMARAMGQYGISASVIGLMVLTLPDKMAWLSDDELRAMGVHILADPHDTILYVPGSALTPGVAAPDRTPLG